MTPDAGTFPQLADLLDPVSHVDPWPLYTWLREESPVHWDETNELWWVSRYDDVVQVSRDPVVFTSTRGNRPNLPEDPSLINQDGRQHQLQRGLVAEHFSPRRVAQLEPTIRALVARLLDEALPQGEFELVEALAAKLPMHVIGLLLGTPEENLDALQAWTDVFTTGGQGPKWVTDAVDEAFASFAMHHEEMKELKRLQPGDDLLTMWLRATLDGEPLRDDQLLFEHVLLVVGGSETTRNVIAGGVDLLCRHREQWAWLRQHPEGIPNAAEEIIRYVTPFVNMCRTPTRDVELGGKMLGEGQKVVMLYPAANRDPRKFDDPERFDVRREFKHRSLAFGYGAHFCLGAALARLELRVVLEELLLRAPDIEVVGEPVWARSSFLRGIKEMRVRV